MMAGPRDVKAARESESGGASDGWGERGDEREERGVERG